MIILFSNIQFEPKRLGKALPKWLKLIKPGDRVLLVGISHEPYQGTVKPMLKAFSRVILLPRPEYGTRLCKNFLLSMKEQKGFLFGIKIYAT